MSDMLVSNFPPEVAQTLQRSRPTSSAWSSTWTSCATVMFRQTLLVHQGAPIRRNLDGRVGQGPAVDFAASSPNRRSPCWRKARARSFQSPQRNEAQHCRRADQGRSGAVGGAMAALRAVRRARRDVSRAPSGSRRSGDAPIRRTTTRSRSAIECCRAMRPASWNCGWPRPGSPPRPPRVRSRARSPGCRRRAAPTVTNLRHEPVELPELPRRMLLLLDGTRDIEALVADIVKLAQRRQDRSTRAGGRPGGHRPRDARATPAPLRRRQPAEARASGPADGVSTALTSASATTARATA